MGIEYVMKENTYNETALHLASQNGHVKIVKLLLNAFGEDENEKLIEHMLKEDESKNDIVFGHEQIVKLLLNIFGKEEKEKLFQYLLKENKNKNTSSHLASEYGFKKIKNLLSEKLANAQLKHYM